MFTKTPIFRLGYNIWRSAQTPSQILRQVCEKAGIEPPIQMGSKLLVGGLQFEDSTQLSNGMLYIRTSTKYF